jgi:hypothetical protein
MERKTPLRHLTTLQETRYGSWMDVEQSGGIRCGLLSRINQMQDFLLLVHFEFSFGCKIKDATAQPGTGKMIAGIKGVPAHRRMALPEPFSIIIEDCS